MGTGYSVSTDIHPCRLVKDDLPKLMGIIREGIPHSDRKEDLDIRTSFRHTGIHENSMEEFLQHAELPERLDRLTIRIIGWNENRQIDKTVNLVFNHHFIRLEASGTDETWVLGKHAQIRQFLKEKRSWFGFMNTAPLSFFFGVIQAASVVGFSYLFRNGAVAAAVSTVVFSVAWLFAWILYMNERLFPYVQILITPKNSLVTKENVAVLIVVLTFLITLVQFIMSL